MTAHQEKLVKEYGPMFLDRSEDILTSLLYLSGEAASILTDGEWKKCSKSMEAFVYELSKVREIVFERLERLDN